jgi:hypothetical protein
MTDRLTRCDNCGAECTESELAKSLHEMDGLPERLDPGSEVPAGECACGACAYIVKPHDAEAAAVAAVRACLAYDKRIEGRDNAPTVHSYNDLIAILQRSVR